MKVAREKAGSRKHWLMLYIFKPANYCRNILSIHGTKEILTVLGTRCLPATTVSTL